MSGYLARRVAGPVIAAAVATTLLVWALQVARIGPEVITGATPAGVAARALLLPAVPAMVFALPMAVMSGVLVAGRAARRDGTLDTLAVCGIAPRRILQPFLWVVLCGGGVCAALSVVAEPGALGAIRDDVPELAFAMLSGRATPGAFVSTAAGVDLFAGDREGDRLRDALIARREPDGASFEVFAREMTLLRRPSGEPTLRMRDGTIRRLGADGEVRATFGSMTFPLDVAAARGSVERFLPAGQTAPPGTLVDPGALGELDGWSRYLVLRRLAPPLQVLLLGFLAAALVVAGRSGARLWIPAWGMLVVTFVLLRVVEPWCRDGLLSPSAAVLLPHVPLLLATAISAGPVARSGRMC